MLSDAELGAGRLVLAMHRFILVGDRSCSHAGGRLRTKLIIRSVLTDRSI
jgi:hypothetical protein